MRLTIVGSSPSWPNPGEASSGYLVETAGGSLLLDCGNGVLGRLRALRDTGPTAIVLSHLDPDHISDLWSVMFGVTYGPLDWSATRRCTRRPAAASCWPRSSTAFGAPAGGTRARGRRPRVPHARSRSPSPARRLRFARTRHSAHSYATRIDDGGRALVYTATRR